ncbi:unnamed protein product [Lymnaea stagnalis]|uniref:CUB domain-containing protein n=1 Tax=Lymnaea stagnalis TaxID=6523 RepID=A0AAV2IE01_LYMST
MSPASLTSVVCFVAMLSLTGAKHYPKIVNLNSNCDDTVVVNGDVIIKIYSYFQRASCKVTIVPQNGGTLVASFRSYNIDSVRSLVGIFTDCPEYVQLTALNKALLGNGGYCKKLRPTDHYDLGKMGTFEYSTSNWNLYSSLRTELLVTEVFKKTLSSDACPSGQFDCERSSICIDDSLKCNGYDDCGNDRDEVEGCGLTTGIIVGIVIGAAAFVAIVVIVAVVVVKKLKH